MTVQELLIHQSVKRAQHHLVLLPTGGTVSSQQPLTHSHTHSQQPLTHSLTSFSFCLLSTAAAAAVACSDDGGGLPGVCGFLLLLLPVRCWDLSRSLSRVAYRTATPTHTPTLNILTSLRWSTSSSPSPLSLNTMAAGSNSELDTLTCWSAEE